jgi:hypothetical protein
LHRFQKGTSDVTLALRAAAALLAAPLLIAAPAAAQDFCGGLRTLERSADREFSDLVDRERNGMPRARRVLPDALTADVQTQARAPRTVSYTATFGGWGGIGAPRGSLADRVRGCYPGARSSSETRAGATAPTTWFQVNERTRIGVEETTQGQEYLGYIIVERRAAG